MAERAKRIIKAIPIDGVGKPNQFMLGIDDGPKSGAKQIAICFSRFVRPRYCDLH